MSNSMSDMNMPDRTKTLEEFIASGEVDDITYSKFAILAKCIEESGIIYAQDNIIYDYMEDIMKRAVDVNLSEANLMKYRYKPKRLAFDIYGSTEMYFVILAINGMCNIKDFNKKKIKMLNKVDLMYLMNQIYNAEEDYIKYNRASIKDTEV